MLPTKDALGSTPSGSLSPSFTRTLRATFQSALQTTAVLFYFCFVFIFSLGGVIFTLYILLYTDYYYLSVIYYVWFFYDRNKCHRGGRRFEFVRHFPLCKYFADYFPVRMIKLAQLDPNKNYILGYHPHGMGALGLLATFALKSTGFDDSFPKMKPHVTTLGCGHYVPFFREVLQAFGACSASKESISWLLEKEGKGNVVVIAIGGLSEMRFAHPGTMKLVLQNRKGFVRLAIKSGASLVPAIAFGENDMFNMPENLPGSLMRRFQDYYRAFTGSPPPIVFGRRIFPCTRCSMVPIRHPIDVIVGRPIDVILNPNPTDVEINRYHSLYVESLRKLYDEHKMNYEAYKNTDLEIL